MAQNPENLIYKKRDLSEISGIVSRGQRIVYDETLTLPWICGIVKRSHTLPALNHFKSRLINCYAPLILTAPYTGADFVFKPAFSGYLFFPVSQAPLVRAAGGYNVRFIMNGDRYREISCHVLMDMLEIERSWNQITRRPLVMKPLPPFSDWATDMEAMILKGPYELRTCVVLAISDNRKILTVRLKDDGYPFDIPSYIAQPINIQL